MSESRPLYKPNYTPLLQGVRDGSTIFLSFSADGEYEGTILVPTAEREKFILRQCELNHTLVEVKPTAAHRSKVDISVITTSLERSKL